MKYWKKDTYKCCVIKNFFCDLSFDIKDRETTIFVHKVKFWSWNEKRDWVWLNSLAYFLENFKKVLDWILTLHNEIPMNLSPFLLDLYVWTVRGEWKLTWMPGCVERIEFELSMQDLVQPYLLSLDSWSRILRSHCDHADHHHQDHKQNHWD